MDFQNHVHRFCRRKPHYSRSYSGVSSHRSLAREVLTQLLEIEFDRSHEFDTDPCHAQLTLVYDDEVEPGTFSILPIFVQTSIKPIELSHETFLLHPFLHHRNSRIQSRIADRITHSTQEQPPTVLNDFQFFAEQLSWSTCRSS